MSSKLRKLTVANTADLQ